MVGNVSAPSDGKKSLQDTGPSSVSGGQSVNWHLRDLEVTVLSLFNARLCCMYSYLWFHVLEVRFCGFGI